MSVIIDSGPLVAILDKSNQHYQFSKNKMEKLQAPFYTCESVLSEAFHLLQRARVSDKGLLEMLVAGKIEVTFSYRQQAERVHQIITTYANLLASFADACLVQMYESTRNAQIFTTDNHFQIYRTADGQPLSLIIPG